MSGQSFGPFRIEILGGMDIDGDPRTGVFLSAEIPQLRGVGAMMGYDVVIARADLVQALVEALRWYEAQARRSEGLVVRGLDDNRPAERRAFEALRRDGGAKAASALRAIEGGP